MRKVLLLALLIVGLSSAALMAADPTHSITLKATVPSTAGFSVTISRYTGSSKTPDPGTYSEIDFGTLVLDPTWNVFRSNYYYSVDVGVVATTANWKITHTRTSFSDGAGHSLDDNVNVTFVHKKDATENVVSKVSYANSNYIQLNKADIPAGYWIRIYYGIGSGAGDNPGVSPVPATQPAGSYQGVVTLTLTVA